MKKLLTIAAASVALAAAAADTDIGALVTTGNIEDVAKVTNLTGANAGKATVTVNNNSGTANSVTVYNAATMDTALAGKASTGSVTALETRATALETATNNLTTAVANTQTAADNAYMNATNFTASGYYPKSGGYVYGDLIGIYSSGTSFDHGFVIEHGSAGATSYYGNRIERGNSGSTPHGTWYFPNASGTFALVSDINSATNALWTAIPSWARNSSKPSYNFSELGNKPTTLSGYGITDAPTTSAMNTAIQNATNAITAASIGALTSETDPVWTADKGSYSTTAQMNTAITSATNGLAKASALSGYVPTSRKVAGMALSSDITLKNLSIVGSSTTTYNGSGTASVNQTTQTQTSTTQGGTTGKNLTIQVAATSLDMGAYYIKIGSDGKPHLMLRQ